MNEKKVVAFIVEGPSDEAALGSIMKEYFSSDEVQFVVVHGDITLKDYTKCLVLRMRSVNALDASAMNSLELLYKKCHNNGVQLVLSHVNPQPFKVMRKCGFVDMVGENNFCKRL